MAVSSKSQRQITVVAIGVAVAALFIAIPQYLRDQEQTPADLGPSEDKSLVSVQPVNPIITQFRERSERSHRDLARLLSDLPNELSSQDTEALMEWLFEGADPTSMSTGQHAYLVNEVLNLLRAQDPIPTRLPEVVLALSSSETQSDLVKDYLVQQMRPLWSQVTNSEQKSQIEKALWQTVESKHATRSGTAFLALHQLGFHEGPEKNGNKREISNQAMTKQVRTSLGDPESNPSMRLTALRVIEERELSSEIDLVRDVLQEPAVTIPSRLKAISVLARIRSAQDRVLLSSLADQPHLKPALERALKLLPQ